METIDCSEKGLTSLSITQILPANVTHLKLCHNNIGEVKENSFWKQPELRVLELNHNKIRLVHERAFKALTKLEYLDLSFNNFDYSVIHIDMFNSHSLHLRTLKLTSRLEQSQYPTGALRKLFKMEALHINGIDVDVFPEDIANLPSLSTLNLQVPCRRGGGRNLTVQWLSHLKTSTVEDLSLQSNGLDYIDKRSFVNFTNLKTLNLANNRNLPFDHATEVLSSIGTTPLESLILDGISTRHVVVLDSKHFCNDIGGKVRRISLKRNSIYQLSYQLFRCFDKLEVISMGFDSPLSWSKGKYPAKDCQMFHMLPNTLKVLDLSHMYQSIRNNFFNIYDTSKQILTSEFYFMKTMEKLNAYVSFTPSNESFKMPKAQKNLYNFYIPPNIEVINLDYNGFRGNVRPRMINEDNNLKALSLLGLNYAKEYKTLFPIHGLNKMQFADFSKGNIYLRDELNELREPILPELRVLNVSWNNLGSQSALLPFLFRTMPKLVILDITHNGIGSLPGSTFSTLYRLESLSLSGNHLANNVDINFSSLTQMKVLNLSHNAFISVPQKLFEQLEFLNNYSHLILDIRANPLICSCATYTSIEWIQSTQVDIAHRESLTCEFGNRSQTIVSLSLESLREQCQQPEAHYLLKMSLVAAATLMVVITMGVLLYRRRWLLRWHYYRIKHANLRRKQYYQLRLSNRMDYDAYVIYCETVDENINVVSRELRQALEDDRNFKIFFNGRDDNGGACKADEIIRGIEQSRKVIILVTPDLIKDDWCMFALHMVIEGGYLENTVCILLQDNVDVLAMPKILFKLTGPYSGIRVIEYEADVWHDEGSDKQRLFYELIANFLKVDSSSGCFR